MGTAESVGAGELGAEMGCESPIGAGSLTGGREAEEGVMEAGWTMYGRSVGTEPSTGTDCGRSCGGPWGGVSSEPDGAGGVGPLKDGTEDAGGLLGSP